MNVHTAPKLDTEKFGKVWSLATNGSTEGERAAARSRAEAMAAKVGMTLQDAVSKIDKSSDEPPSFFDWMKSDPFFKARADESERRDAKRRAEVLKRVGSIRAVFDPTPDEVALRAAIEPFSLLMTYACPSGIDRKYASVIDGEIFDHNFSGTARARAAVTAACPFPNNFGQAIAEIRKWDQLWLDRSAFLKYEWEPDAEVELRCRMVEEYLNTAPAENWQDAEDRFAWLRYSWQRQWFEPEKERCDPATDRLEADFATLRALYDRPAAPVQSGRRTNAAKRAAVLSMLASHPELSDREIARRVGVSPQTVNNHRRSRNAARPH